MKLTSHSHSKPEPEPYSNLGSAPAHALRALAIDAIELAGSGHPGMPLGMADVMEVLWTEFLQHNPKNPHWLNRDRFVLSNGHGSMLLYAALHLSGYDVSLEDLKKFRQLGSKTPGHPEYGLTPGVETTTGPLGQGLANAVGMALAERHLRAHYPDLIDHWTYCFVGDGCLMEGISHEAASFAGSQDLNRLIVFWDDNRISIDGSVEGWWQDKTPERFSAYGWQVFDSVDGHDRDTLRQIIQKAKSSTKPVLICCRTQIGWGSPLANTAAVHGMPLGSEASALTKKHLQWPHEPFCIPSAIYDHWQQRARQGALSEEAWQVHWQAHQTVHSEDQLFTQTVERIYQRLLQCPPPDSPQLPSRKTSQLCLKQWASELKHLIGGSADLSESNGTWTTAHRVLNAQEPGGNYTHYGVREFGMGAIMNGMALHGGIIPYGGTFLVFSDYARPAIRLAALMQIQVIFVFTHDSVCLGEDGPTHQPVEQLSSLRAIPGLHVWRPADYAETAEAWRSALLHKGPSCLILSRQPLKWSSPTEARSEIRKGGYLVFERNQSQSKILITVIATGSELGLAQTVTENLSARGHWIRLISMPCVELFSRQDKNEIKALFEAPSASTPTQVFKVVIEAASSAPWYQWVGDLGLVIGVNEFGASGSGESVYQSLGFDPDLITAKILKAIDTTKGQSA